MTGVPKCIIRRTEFWGRQIGRVSGDDCRLSVKNSCPLRRRLMFSWEVFSSMLYDRVYSCPLHCCSNVHTVDRLVQLRIYALSVFVWVMYMYICSCVGVCDTVNLERKCQVTFYSNWFLLSVWRLKYFIEEMSTLLGTCVHSEWDHAKTS